MGQTYMKNGYIVTMGNPETVYDGGGILIDDDIIAAVGNIPPQKIRQDAKIIDLCGKYVLPGLVNTHVHTSQQISRAWVMTLIL
jgi:5-methylthioadenosine/S-adenosylhomocysteine deaminase